MKRLFYIFYFGMSLLSVTIIGQQILYALTGYTSLFTYVDQIDNKLSQWIVFLSAGFYFTVSMQIPLMALLLYNRTRHSKQ